MAAVAVKLLVLPAVLVMAQQRDLQQRSVDR